MTRIASPTETVALFRMPADVTIPDAQVAASLKAAGVYVDEKLTVEKHVHRAVVRQWILPLLAGALASVFVDGFVGLGIAGGCLIGARAFHQRALLRAKAFVYRIARFRPELILRVTFERYERQEHNACWLQLRNTVPVRIGSGSAAEDVFQIVRDHLSLARIAVKEARSTRVDHAVEA